MDLGLEISFAEIKKGSWTTLKVNLDLQGG